MSGGAATVFGPSGPSPGPERWLAPSGEFEVPPHRTVRLRGGSSVLLAPLPSSPLVRIQAAIPVGSRYDPPGRYGLAALTCRALVKAAAEGAAGRLWNSLRRQGAELEGACGWDFSSLTLEVLAEEGPAAAELMVELLSRPSFSVAGLKESVQEIRTQQRNRISAPATAAEDRLVEGLYGDCGYGRATCGEEGGVAAVGPQDVEEFHRRAYRPPRVGWVVVGGFKEQSVLSALRRHGRSAPDLPPPAAPREEAPVSGRSLLVDFPGTSLAELRLGRVTVPKFHPDALGLTLLGAILGGGFSSRLATALRERGGLAYSVSASFQGRNGRSPFLIQTAVAPENVGRALAGIAGQLRRIAEEPVGGEELSEAVGAFVGSVQTSLGSAPGIAAFLQGLWVSQVSGEFAGEYFREMQRIEPLTLQRLARRYLRWEDMTLAAAGSVRRLKGPMELMRRGSETGDAA